MCQLWQRNLENDSKWQVPEHQETGHEKFFNTMSQARRIPGQASGDRLHFPRVQAPGDRSHKVPEWLLPFEEGLSGEPPDSHNVVVEQLVVEPKEKAPV